MGLRNTFCITFPRSGHHLLVNCLAKYFSRNLDFKGMQGEEVLEQKIEVLRAGEFNYCEYYKHCRTIPCADAMVNFQKNHDFDLKLSLPKSSYKIIQYRNPLNSMISYYEYFCKKNYLPDSRSNWHDFVFGTLTLGRGLGSYLAPILNFSNKVGLTWTPPLLVYWKKFIRKWCINRQENTFLLNYDSPLVRPVQTLSEVVRFVSPETLPNSEILSKIAAEIKLGKSFLNFKYYDEKFFKQMASFVVKEAEGAGVQLM